MASTSGRVKVEHAHWAIFLIFFERNSDLATGRISSTKGKNVYRKDWGDLANALNSIGYGEKSVKKWQKTWRDYKCALKKKAADINWQPGGALGVKKQFSEIENKFLDILGESFYKGCGTKELGIQNKVPSKRKSQEVWVEEKYEKLIDHDYLRVEATPTPGKIKKIRKKVLTSETMCQEILNSVKDVRNILSVNLEVLNDSLQMINTNLDTSSKSLEKLSDSIETLVESFKKK